MAHIYENGTRAWQPDPTDGWVASEVVEKKIEGDKVKLVFQLENGEVRTQCPNTTAPRVAGRESWLTMHTTVKNRRDHSVRHPDRQRPEPAPAHEPGDARS